jgi:lysophospholipase L1-like esterase
MKNWLMNFGFGWSARRRRVLTAFACAIGLAAFAPAFADGGRDGDESDGASRHWVATWAASPQSADFATAPNPASFSNQTIRMVVHASIGGNRLRVRLTNELGAQPLIIGAAHVALQSSGSSIVAGSDRTLTFSGQGAISIPKGAPMLSDPVDLRIPALGNVVVTIYLPQPTPNSTFHALGQQTTWISAGGDSTNATIFPTATTTTSWYVLSALEVRAPSHSVAVATLGDSITDGFASTVDANRRWPNLLAERLQLSRRFDDVAVIDHGISGNRVLHDAIGPNALSRVDRDVLASSGVGFVTLLEGINDIGFSGAFGLASEAVTANDIIASYRQIIARAHAKSLLIYGATLTPFEGTVFPGYYSAAGEVKREAVNLWIRTSGAFDAVIDFDRAVRDPSHPTRILPAFDSGDHLHPNDTGYQAMANAIDLRLFDVYR